MPSSPSPGPARVPGAWAVALTGAVALAIAMGIGRFAFTPLMPLMLHDGLLDLAAASWLASANYLGYLVGAVLCMLQPWIWARLGLRGAPDAAAMVRASLVATAVLTAAMALPWPAAWPALRFAAGVACAFVFVYISGWCLGQLARRGRAALGGSMYTGPGVGIVASGVVAGAVQGAGGGAAEGWALFAALALVLALLVRPVLLHGTLPPLPAASTGSTPAGAPGQASAGELALLIAGYGCAGFGYIVSATFLPVIARQALPGSPWLGLFWPLLGVGVVVGALLTTRVSLARELRRMLALCHVVQAAGVSASLASATAPGFVVGSVLLGLPFTAITYFAVQEVRRLRPVAPASAIGMATALYGIGQVAGPPLVAWLIGRAGSAARGFDWSLAVASGTLVLGAALYLWSVRVYPKAPPGAQQPAR